MAPVYKSEQPHSLYRLENRPFLLTSFSSVESLWFNIGHQLALMSFHLSKWDQWPPNFQPALQEQIHSFILL
jgi:hypothetical protein